MLNHVELTKKILSIICDEMRMLKLYKFKHVSGREVEIVSLSECHALTHLGWQRDECQLLWDKEIVAMIISDRDLDPIRFGEFKPNLLSPSEIAAF